MPSIEFVVDENGETNMTIKGIKGKGCKPIHKAVSDSLLTELGIDEREARDTPEMYETETQRNAPVRRTVTQRR